MGQINFIDIILLWINGKMQFLSHFGTIIFFYSQEIKNISTSYPQIVHNFM